MLLQIKRWFHKSSPEPLRKSYMWIRELKGYAHYREFFAIKEICGGLLPAEVYREIYDTMQQVKEFDVVEIGGAAGAGSIAAAWGLEAANHPGHLIVVEKCEGGSRTRYGGKEENIARIESNFRTFGVHDRVKLFPHKLTRDDSEQMLNLIETDRLGALILDADGRLDRDFELFWPRLADGAPIIIDDYKNTPKYCPRSEEMPDGGIKDVLTFRLLNQLMEWGLFEMDNLVATTAFGHKPREASWTRFDTERLAQIVKGVQREWRKYLENNNLPLDIR